MTNNQSEQRWASISALATIGALSFAATTILVINIFKLHKPVFTAIVGGAEGNTQAKS